jgi:hydrogenase maturation protease
VSGDFGRPTTIGLLVLAYGNDIMGDDASGPEVARLLQRRPMAGVEVQIHHQLVPELADPVSCARHVVFVDARVPDGSPRIRLAPILPCAPTSSWGHASDPSAILHMAQALFGHAPPAWMLALPSVAMNLGEPISPIARRGIRNGAAALRRLARRLGYGSPDTSHA